MAKGTQKMSSEQTMDNHVGDTRESVPPAKAGLPPVVAESAGAAMWVRNTWTITVREFKSYFDSVVAYIVLGVGLLSLGGYFFLLNDEGGSFFQASHAAIPRLFKFMPMMLPIVCSVVTMRSIAEEKRMGTLELLITLPVRDSEVIVGKYLGALGLVLVMLLASTLYPITMFGWPWHLGAIDWGAVWVGYVGLIFYAGAGVAIGLLFSSITESQIVAFFLSLFTLVVLYVLGKAAVLLGGLLGDIFAFISLGARFDSFGQGVIDTRAIVYFTSIIVICLLVAFRNLESRKWK